jgi:predicted nucleotidyltransferase
MQPTTYPHVNEVLADLLARMQRVLDRKLVGLYLYGSLVTGDFDDQNSDIDLLAAIASDLTDSEFDALNAMHGDIVTKYPRWLDKLEIAYLTLHALKTFRTETSKIGIISPGEPFHFRDAGSDWLVNWYVVRQQGLTLFGPAPSDIIDPISKDEFIQTVKSHMVGWREWIDEMRSRPSQAYAILTMCRALYTFRNAEQVSKPEAARWAARELPEWAPLIENALAWRQAWRDQDVDHAATFPETRRFVFFVIDLITGQAANDGHGG